MKFLRRRTGSADAAPAVTSLQSRRTECPRCGAGQLFTHEWTREAIHQLDDVRSISREVTQTEVYCRACDFLVNDDLYGDVAQAHADLMERAGGGWPNLSAEVERAMKAIAELPPSSEAEVRSDFDRIKNTWGAVALVSIPASDLEQTLRLLITGYLGEGAYRVSLQFTDEKLLLIAFITATGFRGVRLGRSTDGTVHAYGQIYLYRYLDLL